MKKIKTFLILMAMPAMASAQFKIANELQLPSTDAWNFTKYGEVSPSLYTGTVNLSIPFYTYKDADFEIPVSFDYASNGNIANVRGGVLGHDWTLNGGGCITREIRGIPDNTSNRHGIQGFYQLHKNDNVSKPDDPHERSERLHRMWDIKNPNTSMNFGTVAPEIIYNAGLPFSTSQKFDAEPDIFHFNFMGYYGTFHFGFYNKLHVYNTNINPKDIKIEITLVNDVTTINRFSAITISVGNGCKYVFDSNGYTGNNLEVVEHYNGDLKRVITWRLTKIIAPNGRTVTFNYSRYPTKRYRPGTYCDNGQIGDIDPNGTTLMDKGLTLNEEFRMYESKSQVSTIQSITVDNGVEIIFDYMNLPTGQKELFFDTELKEIDDETVRLKNIKVKYNSQVLKECNLIYKSKNYARSYLDSVKISGEGTYSMNYYKWNDNIDFPVNGIYGIDHWGYYNGKNTNQQHPNSFLKISTIDSYFDETINPSQSNRREPDPEYTICGMLEKIKYPTGGYSMFEYEPHDYSQAVKRRSTSGFMPNLYENNKVNTCGGLRIKSIKNYLENDSISTTKEFEYLHNGASSGILLHMPRYQINYTAEHARFDEKNISLWSTSFIYYNGTHIEYKTVVEKRNDGSKIEYNFTTAQDYIDKINPYLAFYYYVQGEGWYLNNAFAVRSAVAPNVSYQSLRGKLIRKNIFEANNPIPIFTESNTYYDCLPPGERRFDYVPVYLIHAFGYTPIFVGRLDMINSSKTQRFGGSDITESTSYTYNARGQISTTTIIGSRGDKIVTKHRYATDLANATGIHNEMILNNMVNEPIEDSVYLIKSKTAEIRLVKWVKYNYYQPNSSKRSLIRLQSVDEYDKQEKTWVRSATFVHSQQGRLLQKTDRNGISTSYIWGYNGLYPVAKIDNCSIDKVKNISGLQNIQALPLTGELSSVQENALRGINEAEVTTLEYFPFTGLKKISDPTGKSTHYKHNSTGKLEAIFDDYNSLLNKYYYSTDDTL